MRGHDFEYGKTFHFVRMVESQPACHPAATIVAGKVKAAEAKLLHDADLILRHGAF